MGAILDPSGAAAENCLAREDNLEVLVVAVFDVKKPVRVNGAAILFMDEEGNQKGKMFAGFRRVYLSMGENEGMWRSDVLL